MQRSPAVKASLVFFALAVICLGFADIAITTLHPWQELGRLAYGLITPDFLALDTLMDALLQTIAFAFLGVAVGSTAGFALSLLFHIHLVRSACAFLRAIHELFWALIFLQLFGFHPLTGILAIGIPYAGTFAKLYAEILEEADPGPLQALPHGSGHIATFFFARLPEVWSHIKTYTLYRLECALRSSAVLGFVGLPTLGYYLQSSFYEGYYSEVSALLFLFYVLIATIPLWVRTRLLPVYLLAAPWVLGGGMAISMDNIVRFLTQDIVPHPLRSGASWQGLSEWIGELLVNQALPGIAATLILTQIALVGTGLIALLVFPVISRQFFGPWGRTGGHLFLVIARSTPEYILAYILLQLWGPSMLPAIIALALHNGAIIGHLIGRYADTITLRLDSARGVNRYSYEIVPRSYGQFLAFLFYRWEIILRETAILGILGIHTLGFYIDSAIQDIRFDRAIFLILITALLNITIDALSRFIRARLRLKTTPEYKS